jgi:hypothetical protein
MLALLGTCEQTSRPGGLEAQVKALEAKLASLESELNEVKRDVSIEKMIREVDGIAYLTPASENYASVSADFGRLTVSLKNVQPYANGSKVTLRFGNLTSATIQGLRPDSSGARSIKKGCPSGAVKMARCHIRGGAGRPRFFGPAVT